MWHFEEVLLSVVLLYLFGVSPKGKSALHNMRHIKGLQCRFYFSLQISFPNICVMTRKASNLQHLTNDCRCALDIGSCLTNCHSLQLKTGNIFDFKQITQMSTPTTEGKDKVNKKWIQCYKDIDKKEYNILNLIRLLWKN